MKEFSGGRTARQNKKPAREGTGCELPRF